VQVRNSHALDRRGQPATEPTAKMVHRAVMELTGTSSPRDAWSKIFSPTDIVGIKPNCFAPKICPVHPATMDAVLEGLKLAGVPDRNLLIWDMWHFSSSPIAARYRRRKIKVGFVKTWGYTRQRYRLPKGPPTAVALPLARATKVINMPVFKDHAIAGVTVAMKNLTFGSIPTPHHYHGNHCDPGIANVYNLPVFKDKVALTLADGFYLVYDKGPQGQRTTRQRLDSIFATTDPVALDRLAWHTVDGVRKDKGLPLLMERNTGSKRWPRGRPQHVLTAGELGLGESDFSKIKVVTQKTG
jgi:uncharacterized protein (DUF362 family)